LCEVTRDKLKVFFSIEQAEAEGEGESEVTTAVN
jgi:hypothetical protein